MSLLDHIERLQKSSVAKRKMILAISVTFLMSIIVGLWIWQQGYESPVKMEIPTAGPLKIIWESLKENVKNIYENQ